MAPPFPPERLGEVSLGLGLLTLDLVLPLYANVGLEVGKPEELVQVLRALWSRHSPWALERLGHQRWQQEVFQELETRFDSGVRDKVQDWLATIHLDSPETNVWKRIIAFQMKDPFAIAPRLIRSVRRIWSLGWVPSESSLVPSSTWDLEFCRGYLLDGQPLEPGPWVTKAVEEFNLKLSITVTIAETWPESEVTLATAWAQGVAASQLMMDPQTVPPLSHQKLPPSLVPRSVGPRSLER